LSPFMGSQQKVAVMDKSPRTRKELEALVLAEVAGSAGMRRRFSRNRHPT
jgi:hypothetical protein